MSGKNSEKRVNKKRKKQGEKNHHDHSYIHKWLNTFSMHIMYIHIFICEIYVITSMSEYVKIEENRNASIVGTLYWSVFI